MNEKALTGNKYRKIKNQRWIFERETNRGLQDELMNYYASLASWRRIAKAVA